MSASLEATLVAELLRLTPRPPADADPANVLTIAADVLTAVAPVIARLRGVDLTFDPQAREALVEVCERTRGWLHAAERARARTLTDLTAVSRARRRTAMP